MKSCFIFNILYSIKCSSKKILCCQENIIFPSLVNVCCFFLLDSSIVDGVVLQDLLAYVSSKHSYLRDLPQRQPQKMSSIEFVELEQLQPDVLVHAVLRVTDITILTGNHFGHLLNFRL